ncbi:MAG TPA: hypothetical protein VG734_06775 [Lacunisphaera sp.]|nr:hypothetical protein [Lacunisphaera sp.]
METFDTRPDFNVSQAEYHRLLGYPRGHEPGERARELMAWARDWYAQHGRPWVYLRRAELELTAGELRLDGVTFHSQRLREHLREHGAMSAAVFAVSAGRECEEHARQTWGDAKPDEYFFLEMYGSAVVEDLVARTSARICDLAAHQGLMAVPHYSPGYTGWDVAEQNPLFDLIKGGLSQPFPGPLEVLSSGMLRPKKSLLAVFGLAPAKPGAATAPTTTPCEGCSFSPCQYRRTAYRHAVGPVSDRTSGQSQTGPTEPRYSTSVRALRKWAGERVRLDHEPDRSVRAVFRFDGTTCSNMGRPLAFEYRVSLSRPEDGYRILAVDCSPAAGDEGYQYTCAYLSDADGLMRAIGREKPLLGQPLEDVLSWSRTNAPSGCHCTADSRAHKWGLALEAIHFALTQSQTLNP